jgi:hypothetical protein
MEKGKFDSKFFVVVVVVVFCCCCCYFFDVVVRALADTGGPNRRPPGIPCRSRLVRRHDCKRQGDPH